MTQDKNSKLHRNEKTKEEARELVIERIKAVSNNLKICVGSSEYSKEEILKSLKEDNELGKEIIDIQLEYLRDIARGAIYQN